MSESKAMILGCAGRTPTREEIRFYGGESPWGFILFARNIAEAEQVRDLVDALRDSVGRPDAPVFIDQEGGRVQRLRPPLAPNYPAAARIGELWRGDHGAGERAAWLLGRLHAFDLARYRITVDCLPVLDIPVEGASEVIGARAWGRDVKSTIELGGAAARGLMAGGVMPVMKHIPGHGRATADTHFALPTVTTPLAELERQDFEPFRALADLPMAMSAHVIFSAVDPDSPATTSGKVIAEVIRGTIGFEGLLISDDTSMKALGGTFPEKAAAILDAGCDIVLHCNGVMEEMAGIASRTRPLEGTARERAGRAVAGIGKADDCREEDLRAEFAEFFEAVA